MSDKIIKINSRTTAYTTALFINIRTLRFKSQFMFAFFAAANHLSGPLRKHKFTSKGSKGHSLGLVIGGFRSVLWVFVFPGSLLVAKQRRRFVACDKCWRFFVVREYYLLRHWTPTFKSKEVKKLRFSSSSLDCYFYSISLIFLPWLCEHIK